MLCPAGGPAVPRLIRGAADKMGSCRTSASWTTSASGRCCTRGETASPPPTPASRPAQTGEHLGSAAKGWPSWPASRWTTCSDWNRGALPHRRPRWSPHSRGPCSCPGPSVTHCTGPPGCCHRRTTRSARTSRRASSDWRCAWGMSRSASSPPTGLLWVNDMWRALHGDPAALPAAERNLARAVLGAGPAHAALHPMSSANGADTFEAALVADLKDSASRYPADAQLTKLIDDLNDTSAAFVRLWAASTPAVHTNDRKTIQHPAVGSWSWTATSSPCREPICAWSPTPQPQTAPAPASSISSGSPAGRACQPYREPPLRAHLRFRLSHRSTRPQARDITRAFVARGAPQVVPARGRGSRPAASRRRGRPARHDSETDYRSGRRGQHLVICSLYPSAVLVESARVTHRGERLRPAGPLEQVQACADVPCPPSDTRQGPSRRPGALGVFPSPSR